MGNSIVADRCLKEMIWRCFPHEWILRQSGVRKQVHSTCFQRKFWQSLVNVFAHCVSESLSLKIFYGFFIFYFWGGRFTWTKFRCDFLPWNITPSNGIETTVGRKIEIVGRILDQNSSGKLILYEAKQWPDVRLYWVAFKLTIKL